MHSANINNSLKSPNGEWDHATGVYQNYRHAFFDGGEQNKKYLVYDFGSIPLSSKVIFSGAGDQNLLKIKLRMNATKVEAIEKSKATGLMQPVVYKAMWQVARTDMEPRLYGDVSQDPGGAEALQLLADMTNGVSGM